MTLELNQQFSDWNSCVKNHNEFCDKTFHPLLSKSVHTTSVESYNKRKDVKEKLSEKLVYQKVTIPCIHYGTYQTKSKGQRETSTFRKQCRAHVTYSASSRSQILYVKNLNLYHNHEIMPELYAKYPPNRALRQASENVLQDVKMMVEVSGDKKKMILKIQEKTSKYDIPKSLNNLQAKLNREKKNPTLNSAQRFIVPLQKPQLSDPNMSVKIQINEESNELDLVFWQTGRMKGRMELYPEHLLCDATYNLNSCKMPLYIIMVVDGNNVSEIVAFCLVKLETKDSVTKMFQVFQKHNPKWVNVKTVMVDKDLTEISVISSLFPKAIIEICLFHVLKTFKAKIHSLRLNKESDQLAREYVQKLAYASSEPIFKVILGKMSKDEHFSKYPQFITYVRDNWVRIKAKWVMCYRRQHFNLGDDTNNRLESLNEKMKRICSKNAALEDFYENLMIHTQYIRLLHEHDKFAAQTKTKFYRFNMEDEKLKEAAEAIQASCVPALTKLIVKNLKEGTSTDTLCEALDNTEQFLVKSKGHKDALCTGEGCSCSTFKSKGVPCLHIFSVRKFENKPLFEIQMLPPRLLKERWMKGLSTGASSKSFSVVQTSDKTRWPRPD